MRTILLAFLVAACGGGNGGTPTGAIETGVPDGGGSVTLTLGGASIEGSIDERDMDVMSFSPDFPELRGDQYRIELTSTGPFVVGVQALMTDGKPNIIDYVIEAAPDGNAALASGHNAADVGQSECRMFNTGMWTIRVVTFGGLPTAEELVSGTTRYRIKAEMAASCTFD